MKYTPLKAKSKHIAFLVAATVALAFLSRLGVRLVLGEHDFWRNSYSLYYSLAQNIVLGKGFCFEKNTCAWLPPVYPLFLTISVLSGNNYLFIVILQALLGAGTALCAFLIGRHIFNTSVGIVACAIAACYPYYVIHDTALQETGMFTLATALAIWLLLRASEFNRNADWFIAGMALGAVPLIRASGASVVAVGLLWCAGWAASGNYLNRLRKSLVLLLAIALVTGPWLVRNYHLTGAPTFSSQTGWALWTGNNPQTFSHYPAESIDRSREKALLTLSQIDRADLKQLDENRRSILFAQRAVTYMRQNPWSVVQGMIRKVEAAFSWRLNPFRGSLAQVAYSIAYVPIAFFGVVGLFLAGWRREVILIGMLFIAFTCVSAVFWAHTSHRSYLDIYLIVFAASVMQMSWTALTSVAFRGPLSPWNWVKLRPPTVQKNSLSPGLNSHAILESGSWLR